MFSLDSVKMTVTPGSCGKNLFKTAEQLTQLCTMAQLSRLAENCGGVKINRKDSRLRVAARILAVLLSKNAEKMAAAKPVKKPVLKPKPKPEPMPKEVSKGRKERVVCVLDAVKLRNDVLPKLPENFLKATLRALLGLEEDGRIVVTKSKFSSLNIVGPRNGDTWRNFSVYRCIKPELFPGIIEDICDK